MLSQDVQDLMSRSMKIHADAENLRRQNIELISEVRERDTWSTVKSAWLKAVTDKSSSVKVMLTASCVEGANSRWSPHCIAKGASKVETDVNRALRAVSREVADAIKRKFSIIGL